MTTHDTTKLGLAFAIAAFGMPTPTTALAGVLRVYQIDPDTRQPRLVADELPQLAKRPIAVSRPSRFPNRRPRANVRQIFQRNRPLRVFGFLNQPLADNVVRVFLKAPLT